MSNEAQIVGNKISLNGWFQTSVIGFAGLVITVLTILIGNVIANDQKNTSENTSIRAELKDGDERILDIVEKKIDKVDGRITKLEDKIDILLTRTKR